MTLSFIGARIKAIILLIIGGFRRALCCIRRRRRSSHSDSETLTTVGVVPAYTNSSVHDTDKTSDNENWQNWEDKPVTVQDYIERFRQQKNVREPTPEPPPDYFQDMTPQFTGQTKVLIGNEALETPNMSRLTLQSDILYRNELEVWDEGDNGWEGDNENTLDLLREQKRQERREKALKAQAKKCEQKSSHLGTRLSNS